MWKHKIFHLFMLLSLAAFICLYLCIDLSPKVETVFISVATGILASLVVTWYTEIKSNDLLPLDDLAFEIEIFDRDVRDLINRVERIPKAQTIAESYLHLQDKQQTIAEKYNVEKHLKKPVPVFGDQESIDDKVIGIVIQAGMLGEAESPEDKSILIGVVRDSLVIMLQQNRLCLERVREAQNMARRIL